MYSIIVTAKMNDIDPQVWLADVLSQIATHPVHSADFTASLVVTNRP